MDLRPSKKALEQGIKSFRNYEMAVTENEKYLILSCSHGSFRRAELKIFEIYGSDTSPKIKSVDCFLENLSGNNSAFSSLCVWKLEDLGFDLTQFDLFKETEEENMFGLSDEDLQKDRFVIYGLERGTYSLKNLVSYFFNGKTL